MPLVEDAKKYLETLTGVGRPGKKAIAALIAKRQPATYAFSDDGKTPNNPRWPVILYRRAVRLPRELDPAGVFETVFARHRWSGTWRNGMYPYNHFHTSAHECLGIARGWVRAQVGGAKGRRLILKAGDVIVFPAGTGHRRLAQSRDLLIVGAYPGSGRYDEPRPGEVDPEEARRRIAKVKRPATDPVYGAKGPLRDKWQA